MPPLILAEYLRNGAPFESLLWKMREFVYYIAALKYVLVKPLAETCFWQDGLNRFKPLTAETCQPG